MNQEVLMMNGDMVTGKIKGYEPKMGPTAKRYDDNIVVYNSDTLPLQGTVEVESRYGSKRSIDLTSRIHQQRVCRCGRRDRSLSWGRNRKVW